MRDNSLLTRDEAYSLRATLPDPTAAINREHAWRDAAFGFHVTIRDGRAYTRLTAYAKPLVTDLR